MFKRLTAFNRIVCLFLVALSFLCAFTTIKSDNGSLKNCCLSSKISLMQDVECDSHKKPESVNTGRNCEIDCETARLCSGQIGQNSNNNKDEKISCDNFFTKFFNWIFGDRNADTADTAQKTNGVSVYVGGIPLGFALDCKGAVVVGTSDVITKSGAVNPAAKSKILPGDILLSVEGEIITGAKMLDDLINSADFAGKILNIEIVRKGQTLKTQIEPAFDVATQSFKLGLWVRDDAAGVGTLSFVRCDNRRFGALGHPVCDVDTGSILPIDKGSVYNCDIVGVKKGERGTPGELKGLFLRNGDKLGELDNNTGYGVFGVIPQEEDVSDLGEPVLTAARNEVRLGAAKVRCTIDGEIPNDYDIEIIKINKTNNNQKNMVIRIISPELISKTGGIVQGMSGSPILQNGKLIGAVTHVFVSDPTKGFATFIDNMIDS